VDLDFFNGGFHVKNLSIQLDKKRLELIKAAIPPNKMLVETTLPELKIKGISFFNLIFSQSIKMNEVSLNKGKLSIFKMTAPGELFLTLRIPEVSLRFSHLFIYPNISFSIGESILKEPVFFTFPGYYTLKAKTLSFSKSRHSSFISLDMFQLNPQYKKYIFARRKGHQTDRFQLKIENITSRSIDIYKLFNHHRFDSQILTIKNPQLEVFRDKNIPKKSNRPPRKFPQQLLREMEFQLKIDHIRISNGYIDFIEHAKGEKVAGKVFINKINANIENITNDPEILTKKPIIKLFASAKIMGKGSIKTNFNIPIDDNKNNFSFTAFLDRMDMKVFNSILIPNSHIMIRSGIIDKAIVSASCNNRQAVGKLKLYYRNFKISLLKVKSWGKYKKKGFQSLMANIVLRQNNPKKGKPLKVGKIHFIREQPISIFAYIWKSLLTGFKSSVGF
jgi:hypothetical protein